MYCCAVSHGFVLQASALAELAVVFNAGSCCPFSRTLYCRKAPEDIAVLQKGSCTMSVFLF